MVAISATRRVASPAPNSIICQDNEYPLTPLAQPPETWDSVAGSRRDSRSAWVERDSTGEIQRVRVGGNRSISASPQRRIAEVTELALRRIAVRFELFPANTRTLPSVLWQLFDRRGRLLASMQLTADGENAMLTSYATRCVCRLVRDATGNLRNVEQWRI